MVGIIVGLAAVIVPSVAKFIGKGDEGALAAEKANVQASFDTLMADAGVVSVDASVSLGLATQNFTGLPLKGAVAIQAGNPLADVDLTNYMRQSTTKYWYCWTAAGLITQKTGSTDTCP